MASSPTSPPALRIPPASSYKALFHRNHSLSFGSSTPAASLLRKRQFSTLSRVPDSVNFRCNCRSSDADSASRGDEDRRRDSSLGRFLRTVARKFDELLKFRSGESTNEKDWDWNVWVKHFNEVDEQFRLISELQSQLVLAVEKEDYEEATRIKGAVAAIASKDTVGSVMTYYNKALSEERYKDAAFLHDNAGAGLVGWWAGVPDDRKDRNGCMIHISAEHGRYIARSYFYRQLAKYDGDVRLFEIYLKLNETSGYKQQAVYIKRIVDPQSSSPVFLKFPTSPSSNNILNPTGGKTNLFDPASDEPEVSDDGDDSDLAELSGFPVILQDPFTNIKVKVMKVMAVPEKLDRENVDIEAVDESVLDNVHLDLGTGSGFSDREDQIEISARIKVIRVPAKVEKKGQKSFSFTVESDDDQDQIRQPLSGSTTFTRIEFPKVFDPLNGLYIRDHGSGLENAEVIQLRREFGQWKDDGLTSGADLEVYEYVEAVVITGDPYVPAGEVAFRAKLGERDQLPHQGMFPEEFGVIARYKGQGRLFEPYPTWVDGELLIFDRKLTDPRPMLGFVRRAPDFQVVLLHRLIYD